ncbi:AAA family ATPase [Alteromonas sp. KUL49]|uniref:AAA family ATPase n=1 Tax=Alteromonas sp. KUL49 TaxID=2480798 RepID=UPI00102F0F01|nr:AAA family ATPase [Alteromonas sp. KUL49]TAP38752.1 hypothetical protein EYS00_15225 [Alteromonas sp. KUL49]GEA12707.1 hypothetical protein KUL49_30820 [Alteromonas sp. KUL49]
MAAKKIEIPASFNSNYSEKDIADVTSIIKWMNESLQRSNRWLSRCCGVSDAYISTLLTGKHNGKPEDLIAKILPIMEDSETQRQPGEFVETTTWNIVNYACKMARAEGGFAIIAGSPGVGKTESLEEYTRRVPSTIYMRGSEVTNSTTVIDKLVKALDIRIGGQYRKSAKVDAIVEKLKNSKRLIILDETDKCHVDTPDPLRTISDDTGCGVILAGNTNLRNMVAMGDNRYDLIESRVVFWPEIINRISPEDVKNLMKPYISEDMISKYDTFDEVVKYAGELVKGSARKLVKSLLKNLLMLHESSKKDPNYQGISREMMAKVAKSFMGVAHPPAISRKNSSV